MGKNLKSLLLDLKSSNDANYIINYFGSDFLDDYNRLEKVNDNIPVLEFLNEESIDIDNECITDEKKLRKEVFSMLDDALSQIK